METFNHGKWIKAYKTSLIEGIKERFQKLSGLDLNEAQQTKIFAPGDMWSDDFDYVGMLKYGAQTTIPNLSQLNINGGEHLGLAEDLQELYESFTDVNYHTEGADLGNAIDWLEDAKTPEDIERANEFMERFRAACAKTLKEIERR